MKQTFEGMHHHAFSTRVVGMLTVVALMSGFFGLRFRTPLVHAEDTRVVTIHIDGQTKTIATNATNVKGVLAKLGTHLQAKDKTEPAPTAPIIGQDFIINVYRARPITILDGANSYNVVTAERSPKKIATDAGFTTNPEDKFVFARSDDPFEGAPGTQMIIERAKSVNFDLYGTASGLHTLAATVGDLLKERGVKLSPGDQLNLDKSTRITDGIFVSISKMGQNTKTVQEDIPFGEQVILNTQQPTSYRAVQTPGANGKKLVTYQILTKNGVEIGRKEITEVITQQPIKQITVIGTNAPNGNVSGQKASVMAAAGIAASDYNYVDYIVSRESGWCATKWQGEYGGCPAFHGAPSSGGYGLCQSTPPGKMASAGADWASNPVTQMKWCNGYALGRYGSWSAAYNHWVAAHSW